MLHADELADLGWKVVEGQSICRSCRWAYCQDHSAQGVRLSLPRKPVEPRARREPRTAMLGDELEERAAGDAEDNGDDDKSDEGFEDASSSSSDGEVSGSDAERDDEDSDDEALGDIGSADRSPEEVAEDVYLDAVFHTVRRSHEEQFKDCTRARPENMPHACFAPAESMARLLSHLVLLRVTCVNSLGTAEFLWFVSFSLLSPMLDCDCVYTCIILFTRAAGGRE